MILSKKSLTQNINSQTNASKITNSFCTDKNGNASENLLIEVRQVIYSMYQAK